MTTRRARQQIAVSALVVGAVTLSGCGPVEYSGYDSGVDGVLWRQIASFEDPMEFSDTSTQDPSTYVSGLGGGRWDGSATALPDLSTGAIVLYDVETTASRATFSVFISSGPRPDVPTDDGRDYVGPSQVYTCYGRERDFNPEAPRSDRITFTDCPTALVNLLPEDAAFASADVFDG